jgi:hypothetical protein
MSTEQASNSVLAPTSQVPPLQAWLARLGLSGKLLAAGSLVGVIAVFLPLVSMSFQSAGAGNPFVGKNAVNLPGISASQSVMVVRDFRGVLCLLGYVAALALAYVLYQPKPMGPKALGWAGVGVGGFIALMALWLLLGAFSGSGGLMGFQVSVGIGAILNLLAAATVATGGFLKAREEQLI